MKSKYILIGIVFLGIVLLYGNESLSYKKQSMVSLNRLFTEFGKEMEDITALVYRYHNDERKEDIESNFNNVLMDISNVKVLLEVSRFGKGLSEEDVRILMELQNFHEYLNEEMRSISYTYSKDGVISDEQLSDLETLKAIFFEIKSKALDGKDSYNHWHTVILSYKDDFSDSGLISNYYQLLSLM